MADVTVKMGVSGVQQFKSGITDAQASVKTFDAALKANEKQLKATGNAENFMQAQTTLLNGKLKEQEKIAKNAEQALKQMEANGVKTTSKSYQDMQRKLIEAQSAMLDTQMELDGLGTKAADATGKTDKLGDSLGGLNKKISLDQVISVVDKLTAGMENAAKKAIQLGEDLWNSIMDSAKWADDTATMAQMYGIDIDTFQRMQKLVTNGLDTSVDALLNAQSKLNKNIGKGNKETMDTMRELGLLFSTGKGEEHLITEDSVELFWKAGQALMQMEDAFDKEAAAQAMFGRSWKELIPLFTEYKSLDEYNAALDEQNVVSEETVKNLAELNDEVSKLIGDFETLKTETIGALAPALTAGAEALDGLLSRILEYLDTPEGKQALDDLGKAVEGLFSDLGSIDPETVVQGFSDVFNKIVGGVQWIVENKDGIVAALETAFGIWTTLKVSDGILTISKLISGITGLAGGGTAAAGAEAGASWGSAFASAVMKAAPWLIGLYTLLNPAAGSDEIGDNTLIDENGKPTKEAEAYGYQQDANGEAYLDRREILNQAAQEAWDLMRTNQLDQAALESIRAKILDDEAFSAMVDRFMEARKGNQGWMNIEDLDMTKWLEEFGTLGIPAEVEVPENQAELLTEQIGTVEINGVVHFVDEDGNNIGVTSDFFGKGSPTGTKRKRPGKLPGHANGLFSVPFDGYAAILHKGEQVIPERQVANNRTLNSNMYIESMYMNNGTDAEGLAAAIASANRRKMRGFGG